VVVLVLPLTGLTAQEHDDDRDHDHLHFSHPMVTESPSPDFDFSALYQIRSRLEGLVELTTERALAGPDTRLPRTSIAPGVKVYPFPNRRLMFGGSVLLGTGAVQDTRAVLLSGFYHF
jgi:hypothetical protein